MSLAASKVDPTVAAVNVIELHVVVLASAIAWLVQPLLAFDAHIATAGTPAVIVWLLAALVVKTA
jgi:hypothetical protein